VPYCLQVDEGVVAGVRRIAVEQVDRAIADCQAEADRRHEGLHEARKRCKKLRALLRLVRPRMPRCYRRENRCLAEMARALSSLRDAAALIESVDALAACAGDAAERDLLERLRRFLCERRERIVAEHGSLDVPLAATVGGLRELRARIGDWPLPDGDFDLLAGGLGKTYARCRKGFAAAYRKPSAVRFHEWRKRCKYHWYHLHLIDQVWPAQLAPRRELCQALGKLLGQHHDLALLCDVVDEELPLAEAEVAFMRRLIALRQREIEYRAYPSGLRLCGEKRKALVDRLGAYWQASRQDNEV